MTACSATPSGLVPWYSYEVVNTYPHDPNAFTQGLLLKDGFLYESTGLRGQSSVRKVELQTGRVIQQGNLPNQIFGEGIVDWQDKLIMVTWQSKTGLIMNRENFALLSTFAYEGEGWGLTRSKRHILMSDGTADIRFFDPGTMTESHRITVTDNGTPVTQINELEWVEGEIFANIWQTDQIARIDPASGTIVGWIDLTGLLEQHGSSTEGENVLNGIAYEPTQKRLFVTGKLWPWLFEIKLVAITEQVRKTGH